MAQKSHTHVLRQPLTTCGAILMSFFTKMPLMPNFKLQLEDAKALTAYLLKDAVVTPPPKGNIEHGKHLAQRHACDRCHVIDVPDAGRNFRAVRTLMTDYTQTSPAAMQALAAKYLKPGGSWRVAVIPQGQSLVRAAGAGGTGAAAAPE